MTVLFYQRKLWTAKKRQRYAVVGLYASVLAATNLAGQQAPSRALVTSSQVLAVMQDQGLPIDGVAIQIAAPVTATVADAQLDLRSGSILSSREMRLRMGCHIHAQCLPFFVTATWPKAVDVNTLPVKMERRLSKTNTENASVATVRSIEEAQIQKGSTAKAEPEQAPKAKLPEAEPVTSSAFRTEREGTASNESQVKAAHADPQRAPSLRSGSSATLEIEQDKIHIRLAVISLQDGAIGDKVRVTSRDHKQVYMAEIIAPTLLKGTL